MGASHHKGHLECNRSLKGKPIAAPAGAKPQADRGSVARRAPINQQEGIVGDQPEGDMKWVCLPRSLPNYPHCGTIEIEYNIMDGIQKQRHPRPGKPFTGLRAVAYLPDDAEGQRLLGLLRRAFQQRLTFTVATGAAGTEAVAWSDIPHCSGFSNPDPQYMNTLKQVLRSKGIE